MIKTRTAEPLKATWLTAPRLFTIKDVAERTQLSTRTIHRLIAVGDLKAKHIGRSVRITEQALQALLTEEDNL